MSMWQRIKNIRIPGSIVAVSLTGVILGTTMVLFISLPISHNNPRTIIESINDKD